jgi:hypothetical protein
VNQTVVQASFALLFSFETSMKWKSSVFWSDCGQVVAGIQESQLMKLKLNWTRWLLIWSVHYLPMEVFPHPL